MSLYVESPQPDFTGNQEANVEPVSNRMESPENQPDLSVPHTFLEIIRQNADLPRAQARLGPNQHTLSALSADSGSSGNCTAYIATNPDGSAECILVDFGVSASAVTAMLEQNGLSMVSSVLNEQMSRAVERTPSIPLRHLLITHLHSDHCSDSALRLCKERGICVHVDYAAREALRQKGTRTTHGERLARGLDELEQLGLLQNFEPGDSKSLGNFLVTAEQALHDVPSNCYLISHGHLSAFHSGDTGSYSTEMRSLLGRAHVWLGDANYEAEIIDEARRSRLVLERTKGPVGHMGNHQNAEVLREISESANAGQLQLFCALHRSNATNFSEDRQIVRRLVPAWNSEAAGRACPAIHVVQRGPQFLFTISDSRQLVLPHERGEDGLLRMSFGETGLSYHVGRDLTPELMLGVAERRQRMEGLLRAPPLEGVLRANVTWRAPGEIAQVVSDRPDLCRRLAPLVFSFTPRRTNPLTGQSLGECRFYIDPDWLRAHYGGDTARLAACLNDYCAGRRHGRMSGEVIAADGDIVRSTHEVSNEEYLGLISLIEFQLFGKVARIAAKPTESIIQWIVPEQLVTIATDRTSASFSKLAELAVIYNREDRKLTVLPRGEVEAREYLEPSRVTEFVNGMDRLIAKKSNAPDVERPTWSISSKDARLPTIRHRGTLELSTSELNQVADYARRFLLHGELE